MANRISRYRGSSGFKAREANHLAAHLEKTIFEFLNARGKKATKPSKEALATILVALDKVVAAHCAASVEAEGWPDYIVDDIQIGLTNLTRHTANKRVLDIINFYISTEN